MVTQEQRDEAQRNYNEMQSLEIIEREILEDFRARWLNAVGQRFLHSYNKIGDADLTGDE